MRTIRILVASMLLLALMPPSGWTAKILEPLVVGWERIFKLDWQVTERGGRHVVSGYVVNDSPYTVMSVRLLVDALDPSGAIVGQQVTWAGGGLMSGGTRSYFEVPVPREAPNYQVRVFSYDRFESGERRDR